MTLIRIDKRKFRSNVTLKGGSTPDTIGRVVLQNQSVARARQPEPDGEIIIEIYGMGWREIGKAEARDKLPVFGDRWRLFLRRFKPEFLTDDNDTKQEKPAE